MSKAVCALLVLYSEPYAAASIDKLLELLHRVQPQARLVLVDNSPGGTLSTRWCTTFTVVRGGSNEFDGWRKGLEYIEGSEMGCEYVVFANDTFCHHRSWGERENARFASGLRRSMRRARSVCGELHTMGSRFRIRSHSSLYWVSTYLFGMPLQLVREVRQAFEIEPMRACVRLDAAGKRLVFSEEVSRSTARQLTDWLYPAQRLSGSAGLRPPSGWRRALQATPQEKLAKCVAILQERYLSALLHDRRAMFISTHPLGRLRLVPSVVKASFERLRRRGSE